MFVNGSLEVNGTQQQHPNNVYHDLGITRNKIVTAQFECYQKIMKDSRDSREGSLFIFVFQYENKTIGWFLSLLTKHIFCHLEPMCNRTWDGWLCWDDTQAGVISDQHCPDYFQDFDPSGLIYGAFIKKGRQMFVVFNSSSISVAHQPTWSLVHSPAFMFVLLLAEMVTKVCTDGGYWFQHPESNRTWTNYTRCNEHTHEGRVVGLSGMIIA